MKILFLKEKRSESGFEGSATYLQRLCIFLNKKKIPYLILYNSNDQYYKSLKKNNINVRLFDYLTETPKNIFRKYTSIKKIKKLLSKIIYQENFTIINAHWPHLLLFLDKKITKDKQIICHWHGAYRVNHPLKNFYLKDLFKFNIRNILFSYYRKNYIYDFSKIHKLVAVSNASKNTAEIAFGVNSKKIFINRYGVEKINKDICINIRKEFNIDQSDKIILSAGRITHEKGAQDFCKVAKKLYNKNLKFIFLGTYRDKNYFESLYSKYSKYVIFPGMREDIYNFYLSSDIFLFLSHRESAGIVLMEAMQFSLPLVGWNIIGVNEIVKNNYNGYLVNFGNIDEVILMIKKLLNEKELYNKLSNQSFKSFANYSIDDNYNRLIDIYNNSPNDQIK